MKHLENSDNIRLVILKWVIEHCDIDYGNFNYKEDVLLERFKKLYYDITNVGLCVGTFRPIKEVEEERKKAEQALHQS